jgi:hypothetical protein
MMVVFFGNTFGLVAAGHIINVHKDKFEMTIWARIATLITLFGGCVSYMLVFAPQWLVTASLLPFLPWLFVSAKRKWHS